MRWPQFLITLINLAFAIYVLTLNIMFAKELQPLKLLWALIYVALALSITHLYMLYMSNKIDDWYDVESMDSIQNLSMATLTICSTAMVIHLGLEYYHTKAISLIDNGDGPLRTPAIPLLGGFISSLFLFTSSVKFKKYVTLCRSIDVQPRIAPPPKNYRTAY